MTIETVAQQPQSSQSTPVQLAWDEPKPPSGASESVRVAWQALVSPDGEYMAYARYGAVIEKFGQVRPYVPIREAESRHISALSRQLEQHGVQIPDNPYLGKVQAPEDLKTAAAAWAQGERDNIAMYNDLIARVPDDAPLVRVLNNLRRASLENHLPAFEQAAAGNGTLP